MGYVYVDDNKEYDPLEYCEPYCIFERKFSDLEGDIEAQEIKICVFPSKRGAPRPFSIDRFYFTEPVLKFRFSKLFNANEDKQAVLIHHVCEFEFNSSYKDMEQEMAEELKAHVPCFYIPGVRQLEMSYYLGAKNIQLVFDVVVRDEKDVRTVSNQLISMDIMLFARGF